ncbi:MAG: Rieske [2Fe-2S] domain protein [Frankiales bacterium]|nr:Rieske [2Fe-2S] domain protein [Frankiales bacterium]
MTDITRRSVLAGTCALGAAALAACAAKSAPTAANGPATPTGGSSLELAAGALSDVPVGGAKAVSVKGADLILTQPIAGQVTVLVNRCTHQGSKVIHTGAKLVCPLHGSTFDLTGKVLESPATEPLRAAKARLDGGQIIVESL